MWSSERIGRSYRGNVYYEKYGKTTWLANQDDLERLERKLDLILEHLELEYTEEAHLKPKMPL